MLRYLLPVVCSHFYLKVCIQKRVSHFYSISRQKIDFFLHHLLLSIFLSFFLQCSLISTFRLSSLTQYSVTCIFFSSVDYRTVICLRLVVVGNDLAENFPREPLDGRCLHKSSWEIIVTCCWLRCWKNGDTHESFLIHQCLLSFVHLLAHFSFFNFILSCQLCRL